MSRIGHFPSRRAPNDPHEQINLRRDWPQIASQRCCRALLLVCPSPFRLSRGIRRLHKSSRCAHHMYVCVCVIENRNFPAAVTRPTEKRHLMMEPSIATGRSAWSLSLHQFAPHTLTRILRAPPVTLYYIIPGWCAGSSHRHRADVDGWNFIFPWHAAVQGAKVNAADHLAKSFFIRIPLEKHSPGCTKLKFCHAV